MYVFAAGLIEHSVSCSVLISRDSGDILQNDAGNAPEVQNVTNITNKMDNSLMEDTGKTNKLGHTIIGRWDTVQATHDKTWKIT